MASPWTASGFALALVVSVGGSATVLFGFRLPVYLTLPLVNRAGRAEAPKTSAGRAVDRPVEQGNTR